MTDETPPGAARPEVQPLTVPEKRRNKRINKTVDRLANLLVALGVAIFAYGAVRVAIDAAAVFEAAQRDEFAQQSASGTIPTIVLLGSALLAIVVIAFGLYIGNKYHQPED